MSDSVFFFSIISKNICNLISHYVCLIFSLEKQWIFHSLILHYGVNISFLDIALWREYFIPWYCTMAYFYSFHLKNSEYFIPWYCTMAYFQRNLSHLDKSTNRIGFYSRNNPWKNNIYIFIYEKCLDMCKTTLNSLIKENRLCLCNLIRGPEAKITTFAQNDSFSS